jgi:hypothetical protein
MLGTCSACTFPFCVVFHISRKCMVLLACDLLTNIVRKNNKCPLDDIDYRRCTLCALCRIVHMLAPSSCIRACAFRRNFGTYTVSPVCDRCRTEGIHKICSLRGTRCITGKGGGSCRSTRNEVADSLLLPYVFLRTVCTLFRTVSLACGVAHIVGRDSTSPRRDTGCTVCI